MQCLSYSTPYSAKRETNVLQNFQSVHHHGPFVRVSFPCFYTALTSIVRRCPFIQWTRIPPYNHRTNFSFKSLHRSREHPAGDFTPFPSPYLYFLPQYVYTVSVQKSCTVQCYLNFKTNFQHYLQELFVCLPCIPHYQHQ